MNALRFLTELFKKKKAPVKVEEGYYFLLAYNRFASSKFRSEISRKWILQDREYAWLKTKVNCSGVDPFNMMPCGGYQTLVNSSYAVLCLNGAVKYCAKDKVNQNFDLLELIDSDTQEAKRLTGTINQLTKVFGPPSELHTTAVPMIEVIEKSSSFHGPITHSFRAVER